MRIEQIIEKYYATTPVLKQILLTHSLSVARKAWEIADKKPQLKLNKEFIYSASLLHDIGIYLTNAPGIHCFGAEPYLLHGFLGANLLRKEGLLQYALVCERHTGMGLTPETIMKQRLPLPLSHSYMPESLEEKLICFADKFFSKSHLQKEKTVEQVLNQMNKLGEENALRFKQLLLLFQN